MNSFQRSTKNWLIWHVVYPSALAVAACAISLVVLVRVRGVWADAWAVGLTLFLAAGLVASLVALVMSWRRSARYVLSLNDDASAVGLWLMRRAFGKLPDDHPVLNEFPWARGDLTHGGLAVARASEWMEQWRGSVLAQSAAVSEELARDMDLAKDFQQALLNRPYPEVPAVHIEGRLRLEFHHRYQPTMAVGGDFFDIIPIGNDCAGIFMTDVMGHGVRSALITAILRALILELQPQARNAPHFMKEINREFAEILNALPTAFFASAFYMVADTTSRIATFACAGHPPPFHLHRDRARVSRLPVPQPKGAALGLIGNEHYPGENVRLFDGHTFIFFTDGVYECTNPEGEEYGLARMEKVFQSHIYKSTPEILDALIQSITTFVRGEPLADDVCLVAVDVTTKTKG
jgi:serine phosphatase RsbU (regulator of sigma subunit)